MRKILFTALLLFFCTNIFGQNKLHKYVELLDANFGFKAKIHPYQKLDISQKYLRYNFKKCETFDQLSNLSRLNFQTIKEVKLAVLKTQKKKDGFYWSIELQEWKFEDINCLNDFEKILNSMNLSHIQFCVNKGGIRWWSDQNSLFIMTSDAYRMTFKYDLIKRILKKK